MEKKIFGSKEQTFLILGCILIVALSFIPLAVGYSIQTPEMRFNGATFNWPDFATHIVAIEEGMEGNWRYTLFFSPVEQQGHYLKLFYIFIGNLFRWADTSSFTIFYITLGIVNFSACLLTYRFIAEFIGQPKYRTMAFLLAIFGSGVGWLMSLTGLIPKAGHSPIDLWFIDPYPFFNMISFPTYTILGQLGMILLFLKYRKRPLSRYLISMAVFGLALQAVQPYAPLIPFTVIGGLLLGDWITTRTFPRQNVFAMVYVGIAQLPLLAYNLWVFQTDPIWLIFQEQNQTFSPPPIYYLWGFFWFWLLLIPGVLKSKIFLTPKRISLLIWIVSVLFFSFFPWQMQRRFMIYFTLPLAILASIITREFLSPWISRHLPLLSKRKPMLLILLVGVVGFSNFYLVFVHLNYQLPQYSSEYYHPTEIAEALNWLDDDANQEMIVLSAPETGLLAGALAHQKSYVAHNYETIDYRLRSSQVEQFYNHQINLSDLEPANLGWVFYGPYEKLLAPDFQPPSYLEVAYQQNGVIIYAIKGEPQ